MSELKAFNSERIYWAVEQVERVAGDIDSLHLDDNLFYLKSEADKVIAELNDRLQAANEQIENLINSASSIMLFQDRVNDNKCAELKQEKEYVIEHTVEVINGQERELRYQKYKRCLAMASTCRLRARWFGDNAFYKKEQWALQWHRRWLELAKKFKEGK